jgi:predicted DNA-binding ribbon-helix-helix protein
MVVRWRGREDRCSKIDLDDLRSPRLGSSDRGVRLHGRTWWTLENIAREKRGLT